jgi:hypothetical protein
LEHFANPFGEGSGCVSFVTTALDLLDATNGRSS